MSGTTWGSGPSAAWFCRLDLGDAVPDHSTFSKNRHGRFRDSDRFRHLFEEVLARCMAEGLVGGTGYGVDASLIKADASRYTTVEAGDWSAAETATRATREYLATLDDAAFEAATPLQPKTLSPSDPAARFTGANGNRPFFAYSANYLVDLKNAVIVNVETTAPIRQAEVGAARQMILRTRDLFGLHPDLLAADSAYGSADMLGWLVEDQGIAPHILVVDKSERKDGAWSASDFVYSPEADEYRSPGGRDISEGRPEFGKDGFKRYSARNQDRAVCALKPRCTPDQATRKISRSLHERARQVARDIATTDVNSSYARKKVEKLFAHLKRILRLDRLRLRCPNGARDEFHLAATRSEPPQTRKIDPGSASSGVTARPS